MSFALPVLQAEWGIDDEANYIYSCVFAGFLLGSLLSAKVADRIGRRKTLLIGGVFKMIFAFASGCVVNLW